MHRHGRIGHFFIAWNGWFTLYDSIYNNEQFYCNRQLYYILQITLKLLQAYIYFHCHFWPKINWNHIRECENRHFQDNICSILNYKYILDTKINTMYGCECGRRFQLCATIFDKKKILRFSTGWNTDFGFSILNLNTGCQIFNENVIETCKMNDTFNEWKGIKITFNVFCSKNHWDNDRYCWTVFYKKWGNLIPEI